MARILFYVFALVALAGAFNVILQKKTMHAAVSLVICLTAISAIYVLLGAQFIGVMQLIVYAGAVMVLFIITIMLLDPYAESPFRGKNIVWSIMSLILGCTLFLIVLTAIRQFQPPLLHPQAAFTTIGNTQALATVLFGKYILPFEAISILILVALIGAVVLAKKRTS